MNKQFYVYIIANKSNTVLYTGLTSNFETGEIDPRSKIKGFSGSYNNDRIVYFEVFGKASAAIDRERLIESYSRAQKNDLIGSLNPNWRDLSDRMLDVSAEG